MQSWVHGRHPVILLQRLSHPRRITLCSPQPDCLEVLGSWLAGAAGLPSLSTRFPIRKVGITVAAPIAHPLQVSWRCYPAAVPGRPQLSSLFILGLMVWSPGSSGHPPCSSQVGAAPGPLVASWRHAGQPEPTGQEPLSPV